MEPGGRRRPYLYADIPVPVLQVPAGVERGPRGLSNLMKENNKGEDEEEKKEADYNEEKIEGKRRGEEDMQDSTLRIQISDTCRNIRLRHH